METVFVIDYEAADGSRGTLGWYEREPDEAEVTEAVRRERLDLFDRERRTRYVRWTVSALRREEVPSPAPFLFDPVPSC